VYSYAGILLRITIAKTLEKLSIKIAASELRSKQNTHTNSRRDNKKLYGNKWPIID